MHDNEDVTEEKLRELFQKSSDVKIEKYELGENRQTAQPVILVYAEGLAQTNVINKYLLERLECLLPETDFGKALDKKLEVRKIETLREIVDGVFGGQIVLFFPVPHALYTLDAADPPQRTPTDSLTEVSVKGPRDAFVEELMVNVALVRKRLRSNSMCYEQFTIGRRSQTKVALLYIEDIIKPEMVEEVKNRLKKIDMDVLIGSSQLEEMIADDPYAFFPLLNSTTRPDFVVDCLIRGRFAVLVEGAPSAVIGPTNLTNLVRSVEDSYLPYYIASFKLMFRFFGILIALFLPGFWVAAASFNIEQLPYTLLATIAMSRIGLPMPGPLEAFLMIGMFELFREAGERLPKAVGQTVAVVGGIVVGDAAIKAGLASTTLVVVAAITAVASFTLVNQSLVGTVSILRLLVLICSSTLGIYGFVLSAIAIVVYLSKLESFGVPYLAPLSPIEWKDLIPALFRKPWMKKTSRPEMLQTKDSTRQEKRRR